MKSIKARVAIVGMGCTKFGERWDAGLDDLAIEAAYEVYKQLQGKAQSAERQLKDVKLGISQTFGGPPQVAAVAVLGREPGYP